MCRRRAHHTAKLEQAQALATLKERVGLGVFQRNVVGGEREIETAVDPLDAAVDQGQVLEAEEVHLEQAQFLDLVRAWAAKGGACPQAPG